MKGLLIKDFKLLKTRGIFLLLVVVGYAVFQFGSGSSETGVGFATLLIGVFSLTTITYDEYENGMPFLFTLPIHRKDYVQEKYLFSFLITTITWMIMSVASFCFDVFLWKETKENLGNKMVFCVTYLIVIYVLISLQIALKLKFSERSGIFTIGIGAIMGAFLAIFYVDYLDIHLNMEKLALAAAVVILLLIFGFYKWAVLTMEKREF